MNISYQNARAMLGRKFLSGKKIQLNLEITCIPDSTGKFIKAIKTRLSECQHASTEFYMRGLKNYSVTIKQAKKIEAKVKGKEVRIEAPVTDWLAANNSDVLNEVVESILFEVGNAQRAHLQEAHKKEYGMGIIEWGKKKARIELQNDFKFLNALEALECNRDVISLRHQTRLGRYRSHLRNREDFISVAGRTQHTTDSDLCTEELYAYKRIAECEQIFYLERVMQGLVSPQNGTWDEFVSDCTTTCEKKDYVALYLSIYEILINVWPKEQIIRGGDFTKEMLMQAKQDNAKIEPKTVNNVKRAIKKHLEGSVVDAEKSRGLQNVVREKPVRLHVLR